MKAELASLTLLMLAAALPLPAGAQAIVSTGQSLVETRLLVGERAPDGTRDAGLELRVQDGWKTYWRSPGEAGVAPSFDWAASTNLAEVQVEWPVPEVFESFGLRTVGYSGAVVLPLRLVPEDPARPIGLALDVTLGVCRDICVFEEAELQQAISPDAAAPAAQWIEAARAARVSGGEGSGLEEVFCRISGAGEDRDFRATLQFDRPLTEPYVALEVGETGWFHGTTSSHQDGKLEIASTLSLASDKAWLDRSDVTITILDENLAAEVQGCTSG